MLELILLLNALNVALSVVAVFQRSASNNVERARERERNASQAERQQLIDRILLQKGYREYAPPIPPVQEAAKPDEVEESEFEGFHPL